MAAQQDLAAKRERLEMSTHSVPPYVFNTASKTYSWVEEKLASLEDSKTDEISVPQLNRLRGAMHATKELLAGIDRAMSQETLEGGKRILEESIGAEWAAVLEQAVDDRLASLAVFTAQSWKAQIEGKVEAIAEREIAYTEALSKLNQLLSDGGELVSELRGSGAKKAVSARAAAFHNRAGWYLFGGITFALVAIMWGIVYVSFFAGEKLSDIEASSVSSIPQLLAILSPRLGSTLLNVIGIVLTVKVAFVFFHNALQYWQKQFALETFEDLYNKATDVAVKDAVLLQTVTNVFGYHSTGLERSPIQVQPLALALRKVDEIDDRN